MRTTKRMLGVYVLAFAGFVTGGMGIYHQYAILTLAAYISFVCVGLLSMSVYRVHGNDLGQCDKCPDYTTHSGTDAKRLVEMLYIAKNYTWAYYKALDNLLHSGALTEHGTIPYVQLLGSLDKLHVPSQRWIDIDEATLPDEAVIRLARLSNKVKELSLDVPTN